MGHVDRKFAENWEIRGIGNFRSQFDPKLLQNFSLAELNSKKCKNNEYTTNLIVYNQNSGGLSHLTAFPGSIIDHLKFPIPKNRLKKSEKLV